MTEEDITEIIKKVKTKLQETNPLGSMGFITGTECPVDKDVCTVRCIVPEPDAVTNSLKWKEKVIEVDKKTKTIKSIKSVEEEI